MIQDFAFPFGVKVDQMKYDTYSSKIDEFFIIYTIINFLNFRILFQSHISKSINEKSFIFTVKSEESYLKTSFKNEDVLHACNPNKLLYGVCFIVNDYYQLVFLSSC